MLPEIMRCVNEDSKVIKPRGNVVMKSTLAVSRGSTNLPLLFDSVRQVAWAAVQVEVVEPAE